jgi:hypothetical protein
MPVPAILFLVCVLSLPSAQAETPFETNVDSRIEVGLRVPQAELQRWLPAPWEVSATPEGPLKNANLVLSFVDRLPGQDAGGRPTGSARRVVLAVPARNADTGELAPLVIRTFEGDPKAAPPGTYKNDIPATVRREQALKGTGADPGSGSEAWEARDAAGAAIELRLQYQRGPLRRLKTESRPHSAVDPGFSRIYRIDQGMDIVKSVGLGIDRTSYQLRVTVPELRKLFDGTEEVAFISVAPWYLRQVSLP